MLAQNDVEIELMEAQMKKATKAEKEVKVVGTNGKKKTIHTTPDAVDKATLLIKVPNNPRDRLETDRRDILLSSCTGRNAIGM